MHDAGWERAAAWVRRLAWISLALVGAEGAIGLWQGLSTGSIALTGWALGAIPEGMAGAAVIWRFTGARAHAATSERRAQIAVAISFWLNAPYIAAESVHHLLDHELAESSIIGIALTATAVLVMPGVGRAQRRLAARLRSAATDGEGIQNYLCAIQAAAVLVGLLLTANWPGGWWLDPLIGLAVAAVCVWQGFRSWRGEGCGC
ncbi:cation transporter [Mycobacterium sp. M1]|uniref:Cation transporter n=1 Tax=Mycolicibacter acidiphilus TaxID=2835306 RepID=A0ABS5RKQ5_9MYCO|nr:cation transporter [Mycolicibacter acidiphilus]MBS9534898.1 cation transporter [Mycolicibacter acidiphilus]